MSVCVSEPQTSIVAHHRGQGVGRRQDTESDETAEAKQLQHSLPAQRHDRRDTSGRYCSLEKTIVLCLMSVLQNMVAGIQAVGIAHWRKQLFFV